jgi:hypothetical protein
MDYRKIKESFPRRKGLLVVKKLYAQFMRLRSRQKQGVRTMAKIKAFE